MPYYLEKYELQLASRFWLSIFKQGLKVDTVTVLAETGAVSIINHGN